MKLPPGIAGDGAHERGVIERDRSQGIRGPERLRIMDLPLVDNLEEFFVNNVFAKHTANYVTAHAHEMVFGIKIIEGRVVS